MCKAAAGIAAAALLVLPSACTSHPELAPKCYWPLHNAWWGPEPFAQQHNNVGLVGRWILCVGASLMLSIAFITVRHRGRKDTGGYSPKYAVPGATLTATGAALCAFTQPSHYSIEDDVAGREYHPQIVYTVAAISVPWLCAAATAKAWSRDGSSGPNA